MLTYLAYVRLAHIDKPNFECSPIKQKNRITEKPIPPEFRLEAVVLDPRKPKKK
jgi:hypothetical protein